MFFVWEYILLVKCSLVFAQTCMFSTVSLILILGSLEAAQAYEYDVRMLLTNTVVNRTCVRIRCPESQYKYLFAQFPFKSNCLLQFTVFNRTCLKNLVPRISI